MGELLHSAPFYQNIRKHTTKAGEILCTGIVCVACNPEKNGNKSLVKILGDVDTVNFEMESNNGEINALKTRERPETAPGCYGDHIKGRHGGKKQIKKKIAKRLPPSEGKTTPKTLVTDLPQNNENKKTKKSRKVESSKLSMKKTVVTKNNVQIGKDTARDDASKYLVVPPRSKILPLKRTTAKKTKTSYDKESALKSFQNTKNANGERNFSRERKLYHTFPGACVARSSRKYRNNSPEVIKNTNFLEMLKTSEVGIYDSKMKKVNTSSFWVEKILKQGVKEEELLPRIPQALKERKSGDGSELKTTDKITQTSSVLNAKTSSMLPRLSLNGKVEVRGGESVLIIEHEHEKLKEKDGVLHRIGFALEERQVQGSRNFPKCSIIEIADSLGEFVEMGKIKVIQRRNKRWLILVEGKTAKDFLLQNGVVIGGRHFELMELKTF
ncbi:uncharacterized protein LOC116296931 [Actinia tenebrosa]|uniref:Uncharacterized protein LOC116296931 n=1 Tax=Actinia tenebrosa TaxID=6105 RepID=A0A6P8I784_ACTTE|nr:uncharacterized protein LOC116296931 [Actinia tenebrosa]